MRCQKVLWQELPEDALLDVRFCELHLRLPGSAVYNRVRQLLTELRRAGLLFRPHTWFSEEWFSPDGVPGIAIPFYLAHPRLARLEHKQMLECEGASRTECLKILRHEAGHALDNAFNLHRRAVWRKQFGRFSAPYPTHYEPVVASRDHVVHLNAWYAQAHPAEDFAETFAVWLSDPEKNWRKTYASWPALQKLEAVDQMMESIRGVKPPHVNRRRVEPLSKSQASLCEHYRRKREYYGVQLATDFDADLLRLFCTKDESPRAKPVRAAAFLAGSRREIATAVADALGMHHYTVDQMMRRLIDRARALKLVLCREERQTRDEVMALVTKQILQAIQNAYLRIPL